jgi:inner membrane protein
MDPFTQGVLGAAFAQSFAEKKEIKIACLAGIAGGMAADIDILIKSSSDPLLGIEFHRHFTHSLWFIPIGGLLVAFFLWLIFRKKWSFGTLYLFSTLGYATHALLDACTSYGTRLLWPLSNARISWDTVSVIDPIISMALLIFVVLGVYKKSAFLSRVGMACALGYLTLGFFQNDRVGDLIAKKAIERGHNIERLKLSPTLGNLIVWRTIYQYNGKYYVDAVIANPFNADIIIEGSSVAVLNPETIYPSLSNDSMQRNDIRRFDYFAQGYLFMYDDEHTIGDLRYSAQPHKIQPIWGIKIDPTTPNNHVEYSNFVAPGGRALNEILEMITGEYFLKEENPAQNPAP